MTGAEWFPLAAGGRAGGMARRACSAYLALGLLASAACFLLPVGPVFAWATCALGAAGAAAIMLGARLHRPRCARAWGLLALGNALFVAADIVWAVYENVLGVESPYPSWADALYLAGYPVLAAGMLMLVRARVPGGDRGALLDALVVATGLGLVSWVYLMAPYAYDPELGLVERLVSVAYPLADVLLLAVLARLLLAPGGRTASLALTLASLASLLAADMVYATLALSGAYETGHPIDFGWLAAYVLWGAAALHPSMRGLSEPGPAPQVALSRGRLALIAGASLLAPAVLAAQSVLGRDTDGVVLACGSAVLFLLTLARMSGLSERKRAVEALRAAEHRYRSLVEEIPAGVYMDAATEDGRALYRSPQFAAITGYAPESFVADPHRWLRIVHPDDRQRVLDEHRRTDETGEPFRIEYRLYARDGRLVWVRDEAVLVRDERGAPVYWQGVLLDVSERKALEERLSHQAFHDGLTGLPNRALFMDRLAHALERAQRRGEQVAVLFLDLDGFKYVNDSLGHDAGDELLGAVAERIRRCLRPADTAARLGGDEFTVLLEDAPDLAVATRVAERVADHLAEPFAVAGRAVRLGASIGISFGRTDAHPGDLLRDADIAMYRAKSNGKGRYEVFDAAMGARAIARLEIEEELRRAIERDELRLHYQPQVDLTTGVVRGFEALVRWEHAERGLILPSDFIPLAEETGLILLLGGMVLREACRQGREWTDGRPGGAPSMGVNLSARQFAQPDLAEQVARVLRETGFEPDRLVLEITESAFLDDSEASIETLRRLKALGVRLAIDDFGTGYSSLSYLKRFPVDMLKIDRSFVSDLGRGPEDAAIIEAVGAMGRTLGMSVLAEGVETAQPSRRLRSLGVELAQGYLFHRPMPAAEAGALLTGTRAACVGGRSAA